MHIHVNWEGPYQYKDALTLHKDNDYGVYQIYGTHPIYGSDVLLYIGKADRQTFGTRLSQEGWHLYNQDSSRVLLYVGRLSGYNGTPLESVWSHEISIVEKLLIKAHLPAANSSGLNVTLNDDFNDIHILNWGQYRDILPEVSGARYSMLYDDEEGYAPYKLT